MVDFLFQAHSGLRYLVLLAGVAAALYALVGWMRGLRFGRTGRVLGRVFIGLLDLQVVLGLLLLVVIPFYPQLIGHIVMMVLAAAAAHTFSVVQKRRPPERRSFAFQFAGLALALVLIVGGILAIGRSVV